MAMASSSGSMLSNWISDPPLLFSHLSDLTFCTPDLLPPPPPLNLPAPTTTTTGRRLIVNAKRKRRKSRAMKSSLTTYISTDAANFRHMVQHVTGVDDIFFPADHQFDPPLITSPSTTTTPPAGRSSCGSGTSSTSVTVLPTLDTSAFLLQQEEEEGLIQQLQGKHQHQHQHQPVEMDPLINCFPTLDSWTVV